MFTAYILPLIAYIRDNTALREKIKELENESDVDHKVLLILCVVLV